jgi:hypothetical protein
MFKHWKGHQFNFPEQFFLTLQEQDVGSSLLEQFQAEGHPVAPGSNYRHGRGIRCSVGEIEWSSPTKVKVFGGYLFGPLGGEWGDFVLRKKNGDWHVISWKPTLFA